MAKKSKGYSTKNTPMNQFLLIAIIGIVTTILAAILPWALNTINPDSVPTIIPSTLTATPVFTNQTGIFDVYLSGDMNGYLRSTSFTPAQSIYLFFNINDPSGSNMVKAVWSVVEVNGYPPDTEIYQAENKIITPSFIMQTNKEEWEIGKYKIELYLNGTLDETIEFEIINS